MSNATIKTKLNVVATKKDGSTTVKSVSYESEVTDRTVLDSNLKLVCSPDKQELYLHDVENNSVFVVRKAGKALTPSVAYNPAIPFASRPDFKLFEGFDSLKVRYEPRLAKGYKAIDLVTKAVEASKAAAKKNSKDSEVIEQMKASGMSEDEIKGAMEFLALRAKAKKKAPAKAEAEQASTEGTEIELADL